MASERYYRVKKDTPAWKAGAVITNKDKTQCSYYSVNELWDEPCIEGKEYVESKCVIENSPEWFERVYPVNLLSKTVYKLKEEAKELFSKEHTA